MGIKSAHVRGFRSLRDVAWQPGALNVLIGPNGSGKSNLLRALALLQRSAIGDLPQEVVRLGGIAPLLWDGQVDELAWSVTADLPHGNPESAKGAMVYDLRLRRLGVTSSYRVEGERLGPPRAPEGPPEPLFERGPGPSVTIYDRDAGRQVFGGMSEDEPALATAGGPFGHQDVTGFRAALAGWSIFHDVS
ncbi:MAG TPA: AAA family ATPase, partial [Polyangiaceae bacterium]|nr:AAA family ATPase [Polyangiaceae bacterium]